MRPFDFTQSRARHRLGLRNYLPILLFACSQQKVATTCNSTLRDGTWQLKMSTGGSVGIGKAEILGRQGRIEATFVDNSGYPALFRSRIQNLHITPESIFFTQQIPGEPANQFMGTCVGPDEIKGEYRSGTDQLVGTWRMRWPERAAR